MMLAQSRTTARHAQSWLAPLLFLAVVALSPVLASAADVVTADNVVEKLVTASTAADHTALAAYFRAEAANAGAAVERHEKMLKTYQSRGRRPSRNNLAHCRNLIRANRLEQEAFEDLAAEQEGAAEGKASD